MSDNDADSSVDDIERHVNTWYPRNILRRTNWLYRVDALRPHDIQEMDNLWELCELLKDDATQFIIKAYSLHAIINTPTDHVFAGKLEVIVKNNDWDVLVWGILLFLGFLNNYILSSNELNC